MVVRKAGEGAEAEMDRRAFLKGTVAVVAAPALPAIPLAQAPVMSLMKYARGQMTAKYMNGISQQIASTIIYGDSEAHPTQYTGLIPRYHIDA